MIITNTQVGTTRKGLLTLRNVPSCSWSPTYTLIESGEATLKWTYTPFKPDFRASTNALRHVVLRARDFGIESGSDPEFFVADKAGRLIPAFDFLPRKKMAAGARLFADGFQAEYRVDPSGCQAYLIDYIRKGLIALLEACPSESRITLQSVLEIGDPSRFSPEDLELGCDPSQNAYGEPGVVVPFAAALPIRFAGGHIHFGSANQQALRLMLHKRAVMAVRMMDRLVGIPSVCLAQTIDNPLRRKFYGRAGEFRLPVHGLEYRVLSNFWLAHPRIAQLVLELARIGAQLGLLEAVDVWNGPDDDEVRQIINTCDVKAAQKAVVRNKALFQAILQVFAPNTWAAFKSAIAKGIEAVIPDPSDLVRNWKLKERWGSHSDAGNGYWAHIGDR